MMQRLLSHALVLVTLCTIYLTHAANLFSNPSFEQCITSSLTAATPFGWTQAGSGSSSQPTVHCSTTHAHTGNTSARFTPQAVTNIATSTTEYEAQLFQSVTISQAGQELVLSYWVYLGCVPQGVYPYLSGNFSFIARYQQASGPVLTLTPQYVPGSASLANNYFYQYQARFTPTAVGSLSLYFIAVNPAIYIYLDDVSLSNPLVVGDPQFLGLRGQSYQVHGIDNEVYNLVTSPETQVNSKFVFLRRGSCPILNGVAEKNCWTHPGSYLGSIGVQQIVEDRKHQLEIVAGSARHGFASVKLNGEEFEVGQSFNDTDSFSVELVHSHRIRVKTEQFSFVFENSDMFINQQVTSRIPLSSLTSHGLFGQTHTRRTYNNRIKHIEGLVDDYRVENREVFGKRFTFNQFQH